MDKSALFGQMMKAFNDLNIKDREQQVEFINDVLRKNMLPELLVETVFLSRMSSEQYHAVLVALTAPVGEPA